MSETEVHDPLTCELCHAEGVSAELAALHKENAAMREVLKLVRVLGGNPVTTTDRAQAIWNEVDRLIGDESDVR